jgi:hypothetical protein
VAVSVETQERLAPVSINALILQPLILTKHELLVIFLMVLVVSRPLSVLRAGPRPYGRGCWAGWAERQTELKYPIFLQAKQLTPAAKQTDERG